MKNIKNTNKNTNVKTNTVNNTISVLPLSLSLYPYYGDNGVGGI